MFGACQVLRDRLWLCRSSGVTTATQPTWDLPIILAAALAGTLTEAQAAGDAGRQAGA
jgi:hypothetical protein